VVNLITRTAWSSSGPLSGTDAGELTRRGLVQANSLRVKGFKRISYWSMALAAGLPSGSASRPVGTRRIATASAYLKLGHWIRQSDTVWGWRSNRHLGG
jgi:hypothetical protein